MSNKEKRTYFLIAAALFSAGGIIFTQFFPYTRSPATDILQWFPRFGYAWLACRPYLIPFFAVILVAAIGLLLRLYFEETKAYIEILNWPFKKYLYPYFLVGLIYIVLSLIIGENHPFTLLPVYSTFPNYAYSFYLSDGTGKVIPIGKYFSYGAADLSHVYVAACAMQKLSPGIQDHSALQLASLGEVMLNELKEHPGTLHLSGKVQLHRVRFFIGRDSIKKNDVMMYEAVL